MGFENTDIGDFIPCENNSDRERKKIDLYIAGFHSKRVSDSENGYGLEVTDIRHTGGCADEVFQECSKLGRRR